jgi:hypothetical protein
MRMPGIAAAALIAAALLAWRPASAQTALGVRVFGGYNTYAMGDAEDIRRGLFRPAGDFPELKDGYSLGVGAELGWRQFLSFTLSYERLAVGRLSDSDLQFPCNALLLEAEYRRRLRPRLMVGVAGGTGYYQLGEEIESPKTQRDFEGAAPGGQAYAIGEWELTPAGSVGIDLGYRWAKVGVDKVNREPPFTGIDVDYSGLIARIMLRYMPRRTK